MPDHQILILNDWCTVIPGYNHTGYNHKHVVTTLFLGKQVFCTAGYNHCHTTYKTTAQTPDFVLYPGRRMKTLNPMAKSTIIGENLARND